MDEQDKIDDRELNLLAVFTSFIAAYASLHKFFLPLALKFTNLNGTPYSEIQPTLVLPIALALLLPQKKRNVAAISFLAGAAILFAIYEVYLTSIAIHTGWIAFSRLLSSIPLAIVSVVYLSRQSFQGSQSKAWLGVLALALFAGGNEWRRTKSPPVPKIEKSNATEPARALPRHTNAECGAQSLITTGETPPPSHQLRIESCGLSPTLFRLDSSSLLIENKTDKPVNLHLVIGDGKTLKTGWNILVRAKETAQSREFHIQEETAGMLYSDSQPFVGLTGVLPPSNKQNWAFSRKPITIRGLP